MVNSYAKRFAFSMIELIFAIVVIAISVASVPIMTNAIGDGVKNNLVQEAVFAAAAEMNQVLSYRWDENSIDESIDVNATGLAKVIDPGDCNATTRLRPGHTVQPKHRRCLDSSTTPISTLGDDAGETTVSDIDDIDDNIIATKEELFSGAVSAASYKDTYRYSIGVTNSTMDGVTCKEVLVTIFDNKNNTLTSLKSYSFNIGGIDFHKRVYP